MLLLICSLGVTGIYVATQILRWAAIKTANRRALLRARILYKTLYSSNRTLSDE